MCKNTKEGLTESCSETAASEDLLKWEYNIKLDRIAQMVADSAKQRAQAILQAIPAVAFGQTAPIVGRQFSQVVMTAKDYGGTGREGTALQGIQGRHVAFCQDNS